MRHIISLLRKIHHKSMTNNIITNYFKFGLEENICKYIYIKNKYRPKLVAKVSGCQIYFDETCFNKTFSFSISLLVIIYYTIISNSHYTSEISVIYQFISSQI